MSSNKRSTNAEWSNNGEGSSGSSKRVRFGGDKALHGHTVNLTEIDDSDLLEQRKTRRGAVTNVAYNSGEDSSDDEGLDQKKKKTPVDDMDSAPGAADDDDDDMFADPEDIARRKAEKQKKKGKSKGFDASEIQGEDLDLSDLDEEDYDSDGNPKIEAFNMKEELEDGGEIDDAGNFIRKLDPDRFHDSWLEGLSRKEIQAARQAHERRTRQAQIEEKEAAASAMTETDIYLELVNILRPSESVVEALQRLGGGSKKSGAKANKKKIWQKNKQMDEDKPVEAVSEEEVARKKSIEKLTDLCDKMMALGHFDIYEQTYEQAVRQLRRADLIADDWVIGTPVRKPGEVDLSMLDDDPLLSSSASWEYKWANPPEGQPADEVHGPFSGAEMKSWTEQGFFSQGILVRMVGDSTFEPGESVTFE
ncbi:hypothetical protein BGZ82_009771 [Podila clonocystis]|nr:hypothetical protein BGZ82_009771 [Podila clonocystis]